MIGANGCGDCWQSLIEISGDFIIAQLVHRHARHADMTPYRLRILIDDGSGVEVMRLSRELGEVAMRLGPIVGLGIDRGF